MGVLELNSVCRLCVKILEKENVSQIFNNEIYVDKISLPERIRYCSSVEVAEGDGLPPQICNTCLFKLNQSFVFRNQCVLADITLKRLKNVSVSLSEIPNLQKIDIENQIIKTETEICSELFEFDDVRHEDIKKEKLKENTQSLSEEKKDSESEESSSYRKKKKKEMSRRKSLVYLRRKKGPKSASQKVVKGEVKCEEGDGEVERFMVEPDLPVLDESLEECGRETKDEDCLKKKMKCVSVKLKKGRVKKLGAPKAKPDFYTCEYCQKVYPSEGGWRYHIHTMHNENYQPFICDLCGQTFKVKKNLECHKNSIHFHLKQHLCDLCGRGFASRYALKVHKIWHSDEKNFTCDICGTKFRTRGKMNSHKSIHGGPKKFMCHICSRDFRWKKDFEIHVRTHTGEKPYKCSHCGKAFASLTNMKKHERNHLSKGVTVKREGEAVADDAGGEMNEFLGFGYGSEDLRNGAEAQGRGTLN